MFGIDNDLLKNNGKLEWILLEGLKKENFIILKSVSHEFKPQGYTFFALLAESHLAVHTYPEYKTLVFHLYSCRGPEDGMKTYKFVKENLKPIYEHFDRKQVIIDPNYNYST